MAIKDFFKKRISTNSPFALGWVAQSGTDSISSLATKLITASLILHFISDTSNTCDAWSK